MLVANYPRPAEARRPAQKGISANTPRTPYPVELSEAEEHQARLGQALQTVQAQAAELVQTMSPDPAKRTEEQKTQLSVLLSALRQIEEHQKKLHEDLEDNRQQLLAQKEQERLRNMRVHQAKAAPPVRMEELRALNQKKLEAEDIQVRTEQAQKPRSITPSGGLTHFRVASDLIRMNFDDADPHAPDKAEAWRPEED